MVKSWPGPGEAAIVIALFHRRPTTVSLAQHVGFPRFSLRLQTIEWLMETFFRGLARVDTAPHRLLVRLRSPLHLRLRKPLRAKKA